MNDNIKDVPMGWDDEIENDGEGYRVLPEGEYDFTIESFARGRHEGSAKMQPCPKAELTVRVHDKDGGVTVTHNLFLNRKFEWKLCQFFTAIKARMPGETLRMNWNIVKGATGRCKVGIRKWTGDDGKEHESNEIIAFINPFEGKPGFDVKNDSNLRSTAYEQQVDAFKKQTEARKAWKPGSFGG